MAASFFHHGRSRRRERLFRRYDHDHRGTDGCEDLQLAVHSLWRPHPIHSSCLLGGGVHGDLRHWGMTGVLMAIPPADFVLHNSLFLIAHFHNVAIGGVVFGVMAGISYWFPKAFGFTLNERLGKAVFWCWFFGFYLAFMPLYVLGLMGATRRMQHYSNTHWQPLMLVGLARR